MCVERACHSGNKNKPMAMDLMEQLMKSFNLYYFVFVFFFYLHKLIAYYEHESINMKTQELWNLELEQKKHCLVDFAFKVLLARL